MVTTAPPLTGVTLKGTRHGLLIAVREEVDFTVVPGEIRARLAEAQNMMGSDHSEPLTMDARRISLDLGWRELGEAEFKLLLEAMGEVELVGVLSTSLQTRTVAEAMGIKAIIGRLGLAHHQGRRLRQEQKEQAEAAAVVEESPVPESPSLEKATAPPPPDADLEQEATLYIKRTLRSGQKAVYPGNIVLWGDLNPGAELEAEGDILVLGTVRGRLFAGCNGNSQAQIYCQSLHATVVRIADGIWTGDLKEAGLKSLPASVKVSCIKDQLRFEAATR